MIESPQVERGKEIEGYAFTFCKAAFLALLCGKYAVLVLSAGAVALYCVAYAMGVREWRCWVKMPWVALFFAVVAAVQIYFLFFNSSHFVI